MQETWKRFANLLIGHKKHDVGRILVMKRVFLLFLLPFLVACSKDDEYSPIIGVWNEYYNITSICDLETGEIIDTYVGGWATMDFRSSGIFSMQYLGLTYEGRYNLKNTTLCVIINTDTVSYCIEELSYGRMILSNETKDQERKLKEKTIRVFKKPNYQLTEDDMKYVGPINKI